MQWQQAFQLSQRTLAPSNGWSGRRHRNLLRSPEHWALRKRACSAVRAARRGCPDVGEHPVAVRCALLLRKGLWGLVSHLETMASASRSNSHAVPSDFDTERKRYDRAAEIELTSGELLRGVEGSPRQFHSPYFRYWEHIDSSVGSNDMVLELGAGSGRHTEKLAKASGNVVAPPMSRRSPETRCGTCWQREPGLCRYGRPPFRRQLL